MTPLHQHHKPYKIGWVKSFILSMPFTCAVWGQTSKTPSLLHAEPETSVIVPVQSEQRFKANRIQSPFLPQQIGDRWDIGDMSDEEQLYLELVNRARANPAVEGDWLINTGDKDILSNLAFFNVDLDRVLHDPNWGFYQFLPVQPLAPNAKLNQAARIHAQDMFDNTFQAHVGSDGSTAGDRIGLVGYNWGAYSENVYGQADSVVHGHAGFQIDWGFGPGGIQSPPGHRIQIHNGDYREFGVGVINGSKTNAFPDSNESKYRDVGPQIVSQLVAREFIDSPFITGVAFYDFNGNDFYDLGEGLGGLTVVVPGSRFHAVTIPSGGYAIPVDGDGNYSIGMEGSGLPPLASSVTVSERTNVKVDYVLDYLPVVTGPSNPVPGQSALYQMRPLPLAEKYQLERSVSAEFIRTEGGEEGLDDFSYVGTDAYTVLQSVIKQEGGRAFRLAHNFPLGDEFLEWNRYFVVESNATITFLSRLGSGFENQTAMFQVSNNDGVSWETLWSQNGTTLNGSQKPAPSEKQFTARVIDLSSFGGQTIRVRWVYGFTRGSAWVGSDQFAGVGWYFDTISANGLKTLESNLFPEQASPTFSMTPATSEPFTLRGRAFIKGAWRPYGETFDSSGSTTQLSARVIGIDQTENRLIVKIEIQGGAGQPTFETSNTVNGPWVPTSPLSVASTAQENVLEVTLGIGNDASRFFRIITQ